MYEQREKPKETIKNKNRPDTRPVVINRIRHCNDYDEARGDFLGHPANGGLNGLLQRQPKGRVRPIVPDYFRSQSSTMQRAAIMLSAAEMLALTSRLLAGLAGGVALTKSLEELHKSPEFERMTDMQKMTVYAVLYKVADKQKPNKTETLPAEFDAHSTTGGSEITEQGATSTTRPITDQAILDLLGPIPVSDDIVFDSSTGLPIVDALGLGRVYSQGGRHESVLKAESKALDGSTGTAVRSGSKATAGNTATTQVEGVVTKDAARKEVMKEQGIPTSQQPFSQSKNESGREYQYEVPKLGGGTQIKSVQQQTLDISHPGQDHWEAGTVKTDPLTGEVRMNDYGRPKLANDKSKVYYDD